MLHKFAMTWKEMGLEIAEDDFLEWYPEVMKQQSSYIVQEAKDTGTPNPGDLEGGKGKGEVLSGEDDEVLFKFVHNWVP
jgi:hypothetical protein